MNHKREFLSIAIGILRNTKNEVLLGKRIKGKNLKGYWEFPGGKVEPNETPQEALNREFQEELGVEIGMSKKMESIVYQYDHYDVFDKTKVPKWWTNLTENKLHHHHDD